MAENTTEEAGTQQTEGAADKTFTQDDVDRIVKERLARAKAKLPDDYEELKAKAAKYDEAQEAAKSDLQRATEMADKYKSELDALKERISRDSAIAKAADEYGIDRNLLSRMAGDVEENAKFLSEMEASRSKYPGVTDHGESSRAGSSPTDSFNKFMTEVMSR